MSEQMDSILEKRRAVAHRIGERFARNPKVSAAVVFGSVAYGVVTEDSDIDMMVICSRGILGVSERKELLSDIGRKWHFDAYSVPPLFPVIDAYGIVDGIGVEIHYQTDSWISDVLNEVIGRGAITAQKLSRPYTLAALLQRCLLLVDKNEKVKHWRYLIRNYPPELKRNILRSAIPELRRQARELASIVEHGSEADYEQVLVPVMDMVTTVLFALNEVYDPAENRVEQTVFPQLILVPPGFMDRWMYILSWPHDDVTAIQRVRTLEHLAVEVLIMAEPYLDSG